jgi:hypothetical protein
MRERASAGVIEQKESRQILPRRTRSKPAPARRHHATCGEISPNPLNQRHLLPCDFRPAMVFQLL